MIVVSKQKNLFLLAGFSLLLLLLAGCLSPTKKVSNYYGDVQAQWQTNVARQMALPPRNATWPEALQLLEDRNLKMRRGRNDITNAIENVRQVFKDLIPNLNFRSGVSESLRQISSIGLDDVTFSVDSFFNIPGIVNMNTRLFAAKLALLRAQTVYELAVREQTLELYKTFLDAQEHREIAAQLETEKVFAQAVQRAEPVSGDALMRDINGRLLAHEKEADALQTKISDLMGGREWRWNLVTNGIPGFSYESAPLPLADTNRVAQLQMRLVAIEIAGAWAREVGIKLQYWPEVNVFVTGPALYQRINGVTRTWRPDEIVLRGDFFWRIDTRGYVSRQLKQARRDQVLQMEQIQQDSLALVDKLLAAQRLLTLSREQLAQLQRVIPLLEQVPLPGDFAGIISLLDLYRNLREQDRKLRREIAELNALMWFVDEQKWYSPTKPL
jgi:hypothetical protein